MTSPGDDHDPYPHHRMPGHDGPVDGEPEAPAVDLSQTQSAGSTAGTAAGTAAGGAVAQEASVSTEPSSAPALVAVLAAPAGRSG